MCDDASMMLRALDSDPHPYDLKLKVTLAAWS